jgi:hypothetical protein
MPHHLLGMERIWRHDKDVEHRAVKAIHPDPILKVLARHFA